MSSLTNLITNTTNRNNLSIKKDIVSTLRDYIDEMNEKGEETDYLIHYYGFIRSKFQKNEKDNKGLEQVHKYYFLYHIPKTIVGFSSEECLKLINDLSSFYKNRKNNIDESIYSDFKKSKKDYAKELVRLMNAKNAIRAHVGYPVINYSPMIIDINNYREFKNHNKSVGKNAIVDQGYYEINQIIGCSVLILEKLKHKDAFFKLVLTEDVVKHLHKNDILQIRMTRRLFFTTWNIEDIKGCYGILDE